MRPLFLCTLSLQLLARPVRLHRLHGRSLSHLVLAALQLPHARFTRPTTLPFIPTSPSYGSASRAMAFVKRAVPADSGDGMAAEIAAAVGVPGKEEKGELLLDR